jgi:hypothetical protein
MQEKVSSPKSNGLTMDNNGSKHNHSDAIQTEPNAKKKKNKKNHTRRPGEDWGDNKPEKSVHAGSFANEAQRQLFQVQLPPLEDEAITQTRVKRKVAFLLAYLGTNYGGFQVNEGQRTLQGDFELALLQCHFLLPSNFGHPNKYAW